MLDLLWLIPALPLAGFAVQVVLGRRLGEPLAGWVATAACAGSFLATVAVFLGLRAEPEEERWFVQTLFEWIPAGGFSVDIGFLADPLSLTMALFVTGIGTLIHLYSVGYMHGDPGFSRFFAYLNLFVASMLVLVLGENLLVTFLGWEGVGACSYLLISFWFTDEANATAGKKAFVTNRIGDVGFLLAIFLSFSVVGTVSYEGLLGAAGTIAPVTATAIVLLLFVGAIGKSAQLPLFVWLPDAMAGPTPVSALIHAATMVTSGVFLLTRVNPLTAQAFTWAPEVIAWVGVLTALFAATVALAQRDIKKVLAYSTVSQLGFMFLAVGVGAYVPAIFHMITHAYFKALLFLGAGSVIHGLHEEQEMTRMGGLRRYMPVTAATFIVGWLAIAGVPPFSGFWSKDEILVYAFDANPVLWAVALVTALLTAFYMSRQVFLVFFGPERFRAETTVGGEPEQSGDAAAQEYEETGTEVHGTVEEGGALHGHAHGDPHESPWTMTVPLVVLAGLAVLGGLHNLPFTADLHYLADWLHPVLGDNEAHVTVSTAGKFLLAATAVVVVVVGIAVAVRIYLQGKAEPVEPEVLANAWYVDSTLAKAVDGPGRAAFEGAAAFDREVVDGAVNGVATLVRGAGSGLRGIQSGYVRGYALGIAAGAVVLLGYFVTRIGL